MRSLLWLILLLLAGCARSGDVGPSLARRPIEGRTLSEPVAQPAAPAPADAQLTGQIEALIEQAHTGQRAFDKQLPLAERTAGLAGAQGSESWIAAQQSLSALEAARATTTAALGGIDALLAEHVLGTVEAGLTELQAAQRDIAAIADRQQARIDQVKGRISR